jgi:hypothetical protein
MNACQIGKDKGASNPSFLPGYSQEQIIDSSLPDLLTSLPIPFFSL